MVVMMGVFFTLCGASFTYCGAQMANFFLKLAFPGLKRCRECANIAAVHAESDAGFHFAATAQTAVNTSLTGAQTIQAILNTFFVFHRFVV